MKLADWPVTAESGPRPAGRPDECFYCSEKIGAQHKVGCAIRSRSVVVRMTVEYVISVQEDRDRDSIEFGLNDSSWCASNAIDNLESQFGDHSPCMCDAAEFEYVREATEEETREAKLDLRLR